MDALTVLYAAQGIKETVTPSKTVPASKGSTAKKLAVMPKQKIERKKRARVRGSGTIAMRGRIWWMEVHIDGQRYRESAETSDRQTALLKLDSWVKMLRSGEQPKKFDAITVAQMFDNWIAEVERTCKTRTMEDYKSRWTAHLEPVFGKLVATQVSKEKIAAYLQERMREGAGDITQNRENRVLQMIFGFNRSKIPADRFPEFPKMHSEKAHVHKGRMTNADYATLTAKLEDPKLFWFKTLLVLTFKQGFRKSELLNAKVGYWNPTTSIFTLPPFTTKNDMPREVHIARNGAIYQMLEQLTKGRNAEDALFHRNGKPVRDYRGLWETLTAGMLNTQGQPVTPHDLRRSALSNMHSKGFGAKDAGTHLTADVFLRYVQPTDAEQQAKAARIES
jgi:integrase